MITIKAYFKYAFQIKTKAYKSTHKEENMFIKDKRIKSISVDEITRIDNNKKISYAIEIEDDDYIFYNVIVPINGVVYNENKIASGSDEFVYGYKVVQLENGQYAYLSEKTKELLPVLRFDFATNFNKYGYAMIAKNGKVSWMNTDFMYLNYKGYWIENYADFEYNALDKINEFSKGEIPLSLVSGDDPFGETFGLKGYIDTNGVLKTFYRYNLNDMVIRNAFITFTSAEDFDESGFTKVDDGFISDKGYYFKLDDLLKLNKTNSFLSILNDTLDKIQNPTHRLVKKD